MIKALIVCMGLCSLCMEAKSETRKLVSAVQVNQIKSHHKYVSPDGLYYIDLYPLAKNQRDLDIEVMENRQHQHGKLGIWYHTTAILWLPRHGHVLLGSGDYNSGPDEIDMGRVKDFEPETIRPLAKSGYQILYGASADGKTITYGYSYSGNPKELRKVRFYALPIALLHKK